MKYFEIEKELKQNKIAPVYLFTGKEIGIAEDVIEQIKSKTLSPAVEMLNFSKYDKKDTDFSEVLASLQTMPVMSEYRIIVIGQQADFFSIKDDKLIKRFQDYINSPSPSTIMIVLSEKPDKRRKFYKSISKKVTQVEFSKLNYSEASNWIKSQFSQRGLSINKKAVDTLLERTHYLENEDNDTLSLKNKIEQIVDYVGDSQEVDETVIKEVIPETVEDNVFKLVDLAVSGKLNGINEILEYFWDHGQSPISLFGLLLYQLRNITKINLLLRKGLDQKSIASQAGLAPFVVRKTIPISKQYRSKRLLHLFKEAAELDFKIKTGQIDPAFAIEYFLLKMNVKK